MSSSQKHSYLDFITTTFAVVLLLSNIASTKIAAIGSMSFDAGLILFPLAYIFGDILTEVYGYAQARRVIWIGFGMNLLMVLTFWLVGLLPADPTWGIQDSYMNILGVVPRIVFASLMAYLVGEFSNSYILAKLKVKTHGKKFWFRAIGSTIIGEGLDTTIFTLVAFAGILPGSLLITIGLTNYVVKVLVEIIFLPVTYRIVHFLKKKERIDYYDKHTNFSPIPR
ncbi:MAG: transporter [Candidatus Magasanikbacteria bacterium CG10_big_fil_rev_8_21_14_0_10_42_10]|uniref:Probable queuosine precursor transporter n=2 Tax=Candidatus Magasanikiibacteriota TaxID=1752731 RepID=A0A2H0TX59_9BACT|nr:MAG: transporter [Candidatus Magasanikbacteria bacterium CG10_big_fil_rev_8_21_14_0_10_42_10]PIZ93586.1 MAG: transporter [Candidatus Magasanikbacteria bacterium CG_4_10_14_0_2_um_filter_41_10]